MKATVSKRSKGSPYYYIRWYDPDTKKAGKAVSTKCKNEREAKNYLKTWIKNKETERRNRLRQLPLTMERLFDRYKRDLDNLGRKLSPATVKLFERTLNRLHKAIPKETLITEFTTEHYQIFLDSLEGIAQNTKSIYTNKLFALFRYAVKENLIRKNVFKRVAEEEKEIYIMKDEEAKAIIDKAKPTQYYNLFLFLFNSAFRIHEALKLQRKDIRDGYIFLIGKGNKMAHIPIIKGIEEVFNNMDLSKYKDEDRLFPYEYEAVRMFLNRLRKKEKLNNIKIHDIRRYCLSKMANNGVPINFVKTFARHSDINTTLKYYVKQDMDLLKDEIDKKIDLKFLFK